MSSTLAAPQIRLAARQQRRVRQLLRKPYPSFAKIQNGPDVVSKNYKWCTNGRLWLPLLVRIFAAAYAKSLPVALDATPADSQIQVYRLDTLSKPAVTLNSPKGCVAFAASGEAGILAVAQRTSVRMFSWTGPTTPFYQLSSVSSVPARAGSHTYGPSTSNCFEQVADYELDPIYQVTHPQDGARVRRNSASNLLLALGATTAVPPVHAAIIDVAWLGPLLCLIVIRRADVSLHREDKGIPVLNLVEAPDEYSGTGVHRRDPSKSDTGYRLSYLFIHPFTGELVREIRAGQAPPIDATGTPSPVPPQVDNPTTSMVAAVSALLGTAGTSSFASLSQATPAASAAVNNWGVVSVIRSYSQDVIRRRASSENIDPFGVAELESDGQHAERAESVDSWDEISSGSTRATTALNLMVALDFEPPKQGPSVLDGAKVERPSRASQVEPMPKPPGSGIARAVGLVVEDQGPHSTKLQAHDHRVDFGAYPLAVYASPNFPYLISAQHDGVSVYHTKLAIVSQHVKVSNPLGIASCPVETGARLAFAARRHMSFLQQLAGAPDGAARTLEKILTSPERVYVYAPNGVIMLRMVPIVMQVAALLSRRPPSFEAALSLCEHFNTIKSRLDAVMSECVLEETAPIPTPFALEALGGVSEIKIRQIRAQFGYQKFAQADFTAALWHLLNAEEPVTRVLSLFPQLLPSGVHITARFPIKMPVMVDVMLSEAVQPLITFLHCHRKRLGCDTTSPNLLEEVLEEMQFDGDVLDGAGEGSLVSVAAADDGHVQLENLGDVPRHRMSPAVMVDTVLLTAMLWREAMLRAYIELGGSPASNRRKSELARKEYLCRKLQDDIGALLSKNNCVDVAEAEMQLSAFKKGGVELIALYRTKGLFEKAVSVLIGEVRDMIPFLPRGALDLLDDQLECLSPAARSVRCLCVNRIDALVQFAETLPSSHFGEVQPVVSFLLSISNSAVAALQCLRLLMRLLTRSWEPFSLDGAIQLISRESIISACKHLWLLQYPTPSERAGSFSATSLVPGRVHDDVRPCGDWKLLCETALMECAIQAGRYEGFELENQFLTGLIDLVHNAELAGFPADDACLQRIRARCRYYIENLQQYDPLQVFRQLGDEHLAEKAEVLRRLSRHADAMHCLVNILQDTESAEQYCERAVTLAAAVGMAAVRTEMSAVYTALLQALFPKGRSSVDMVHNPPVSSAQRLDTVMPFLLKHFNHLDPSKALSQLPADVPLNSVAPLLMASLRNNFYVYNTSCAAKQLASVSNIEAHVALADRQAGCVKVDRSTACADCGRKIALNGSLLPFAVDPVNGIVHLSCSRATTQLSDRVDHSPLLK